MSDADPIPDVDLDVGGQDPIGTIKAMLSGYDASDASRVAIQIWEPDQIQEPDEDGADSDDDSDNGPTRSLGGIRPGTSHHLVLAALDAIDGEADAGELADALDHPDRNHTTAALSKMWTRRLVERDDDTKPYIYRINAHGEAELDAHGRDVTKDEVGGVWTR